MTTIRIATRASAQATTQARGVGDRLQAAGHDVELVLVDTHGDRTQAADVPLHTIGGQGVFVKEVQRAVLDRRADVAVHSAKDLPTDVQAGLTIGAFVERRTASDALVGRALHELADGATVASGSVRRRAQLTRVRPDLRFVELRGNIGTRLERVPEGGSIVMAVAALEILGLVDQVAEELDPAIFVPAPGQGCVAVECRSDDEALLAALAAVDHLPTRTAVTVERAFLGELGSGCSLPVGAYARDGRLHCFLASESVRRVALDTVELTGDATADHALACRAAREARRLVIGS